MPDEALNVFAASDAETDKLGKSLAQILTPGDLILLQGELGTGKSALARATIRALLNQPELEVPSPTYLLVLPYDGLGDVQHWSILHVDLYRLNEPEELDELGLFDDPDTIVMIEWPERVPSLFDQADIVVSLSIPPGGKGRMFAFRSGRKSRSLSVIATGIEDGQ